MNRKAKLLVGGVGIVVLLSVLAVTTMGSAAEYVEPTDLAEDEAYEGQYVQLEGLALDVEDDEVISFEVVDENHSVSVTYDGEMPETMSDGRFVVAEGQFDGDAVDADDLSVRAHEGEHPDGAEDEEYEDGGYEGEEYEDGSYGDGSEHESPFES